MAEHAIELDVPPGTALVALRRTAEDWGGEFTRQGEGGLLRLPVLAGLRRGLVTGTVTVLPAAAGSRVVFRPEELLVSAHFQSVAVLVLSAAGALVTVLWPFFPKLMPVVPFGILLALGGWFLVISRLRNSGPEEFLEAVASREDADTA